MKTARIINTCLWAVLGITAIVCTCIAWSAQGAGVWSFVAAIVYYGLGSAGLAYVIDQTIQGK